MSSTIAQNDWAFCFKCHGLFFRESSNGKCPAGGAHDPSQSGSYSLGFSFADSPLAARAQVAAEKMGPEAAVAERQALIKVLGDSAEANWKWCRRCQGLFYADDLDKTHCPAGKQHDPKGSGDYTLGYKPKRGAVRAAGQSGWRRCTQCQGLFFATGGAGVCPAAHSGPHVFDSKDSNYFVKRANPLADLLRKVSLLVVAPQVLAEAAQELVDWKNATKMPAAIVTIEALHDSCDGIDDPERIKRGIWQAHVELGVRYVLLVGDATWFPVRFRFEAQPKNAAVGGQSGWMNGSYNPTDLYYAGLVKFETMFDDWDNDGNGKYNRSTWAVDPYGATQNPDDVSGYPDVALGRLPAGSIADVTVYVEKLKAYEKRSLHGGTGSKPQVTFVADMAYGGARELSEQVIAASDGIGSANTLKRIAIEPRKKPPPAPWKVGDATDIDHAVSHSWWISYVGHGEGLAWGGDAQVYDSGHVLDLPANDTQPIVFATACETGAFTTSPPVGEYAAKDGRHWFWFFDDTMTLEDEDASPPKTWDFSHKRAPLAIPPPLPLDFEQGWARTFACAWLCNPNQGGGIAYVGENETMENGNGTVLQGYVLNEYVKGKGVQVLGDIWLAAQRRYHATYEDAAHGLDANFTPPRIYLGIVELFGDPSLRLR
jgi:hypothetical protein